MSTQTKKVLLLSIGAIGLIALGAVGMWATSKFTIVAVPTPAVSTPIPTPAPQPVAQVTNVKPHYVLKSVAYRSCHDVANTVMPPQTGTSGAGALIGGIAGGAAASNIGHGSGRTAATIGGVVLGALAGNAVESSVNQPEPYTVYSPECVTRYTKKSVQSGYEVTYSYNGAQKTIHMQKPPKVGDTIPLTLVPAV